jgi:hypothetical protein
VILLRRHRVRGKDYYQVVLTRPGVELQSPLLEKREAVEWVKWAMNYLPTESSSAASKAG